MIMKKNETLYKVAEIAVWVGICALICLIWWGVIELLWFCDSLGMKI